MGITIGTGLVIGAVIGGGAAVYSAKKGSKAIETASQAQAAAEQNKIAYLKEQEARDRAALEQARTLGLEELDVGYEGARTSIVEARDRILQQYGEAEERFAPYAEAGRWGLEQYQDLLADPSKIKDMPGYQFRLEEGLQSLERSAAARGMLLSGATGEALQRYGQDYASLEFDKSLGRMSNLATIGQAADVNLANIDLSQAGYEERYGGTLAQADIGLGTARANIQTGTQAQIADISGQYASQVGQGISNLGYIQGAGEIRGANIQTDMMSNLAQLGLQAYMGYSLNQPATPQAGGLSNIMGEGQYYDPNTGQTIGAQQGLEGFYMDPYGSGRGTPSDYRPAYG